MIRDWIERRKIKKAFSEYVDPRIIDKLIDDPDSIPLLHTSPKNVDYLIILIRDEHLNSLPLIGKAIDIALESDAAVQEICSSLIVFTFGGFEFEDNISPGEQKNKRLKLLHALQNEIGNDISIVHGAVHTLVGNYGSEKRLSFGAIFPQFRKVLMQLLNTPY